MCPTKLTHILCWLNETNTETSVCWPLQARMPACPSSFEPKPWAKMATEIDTGCSFVLYAFYAKIYPTSIWLIYSRMFMHAVSNLFRVTMMQPQTHTTTRMHCTKTYHPKPTPKKKVGCTWSKAYASKKYFLAPAYPPSSRVHNFGYTCLHF